MCIEKIVFLCCADECLVSVRLMRDCGALAALAMYFFFFFSEWAYSNDCNSPNWWNLGVLYLFVQPWYYYLSTCPLERNMTQWNTMFKMGTLLTRTWNYKIVQFPQHFPFGLPRASGIYYSDPPRFGKRCYHGSDVWTVHRSICASIPAK